MAAAAGVTGLGMEYKTEVMEFYHDDLEENVFIMQGIKEETKKKSELSIEGNDDDATAVFVWPAAWPLCRLLCEKRLTSVEKTENDNCSSSSQDKTDKVIYCDVKDKTVIEIGCGPGLPGIVAAKMGAKRVVLSDKPSELLLPMKNAKRNSVDSTTEIISLLWGDK